MQFCVWHVRNIKPLMKYLMMYSEHLYANGFAVSKCFCFLDHEEEQYARVHYSTRGINQGLIV